MAVRLSAPKHPSCEYFMNTVYDKEQQAARRLDGYSSSAVRVVSGRGLQWQRGSHISRSH